MIPSSMAHSVATVLRMHAVALSAALPTPIEGGSAPQARDTLPPLSYISDAASHECGERLRGCLAHQEMLVPEGLHDFHQVVFLSMCPKGGDLAGPSRRRLGVAPILASVAHLGA